MRDRYDEEIRFTDEGIGELLSALQARLDPSALIGNLKSQLLAALTELPAGDAKQAVAKALAGIESEQLLNLARNEFNEGWHLSVPLPDGENWATAHMFYTDPENGGERLTGSPPLLPPRFGGVFFTFAKVVYFIPPTPWEDRRS